MRNYENEFESEKGTGKKKKLIIAIVAAAAVAVVIGAVFLIRFLVNSNKPPVVNPPETVWSDATGVVSHYGTLDPDVVYGSTSVMTDEQGSTKFVYTDESGIIHDVPTPPTELARREGVYTFLLVGLDQSKALTDVIMIATYDTVGQTINVMSIPRDTYSKANNRSSGLKHINLAYMNGGIESLLYEVYNLVGFYPDFYVTVDMNGFVEIINYIGGVYFDVPTRMYYNDNSQNLHIDIAAGYQWLSGTQALQVCRFRSGYVDADIGRIRTRNAFLKAAAEQMLDGATAIRAAEIAGAVYDNVTTGMKKTDLVWFAKSAVSVKPSDINFITFPGGPAKDSGMWIPYPNELLRTINESFNPYTSDIVTINVVQRSENYGK
ncbi:MAG: LCP family protein [Oscillospiraceae bacterium]|nr:LCP family protein [Oscillospiraceae bacterium]